MSKNYEGPGEVLTLVAPSGGVTAGLGVVVEAGFFVAQNTAAVGENFQGMRVHAHRLPKIAATAWAAGEDLFWDVVPGQLTNVSASTHWPVGHAGQPAASADASAVVVLHGTATAPI